MSGEGWNYIEASSFCLKVTDGTHDSPKRKDIGKLLITSKHIKSKNIDFEQAYFISEEDYEKINQRSRVDQWDVLISMIGEYCGFCHVESNSKIEYVVKNIGILKAGSKIKAEWIYYYLNSPEGKNSLASLKSGTSQPYLSLGALRSLPIRVPNSDEKLKRIVSILSALDDKIELNRQTNATLEAIAQAIFKEWFVDFRFPGATGEMQDSELGPIPMGWRVGTLGDICELNPRLPLKKGAIAKYVEMKNLSQCSLSIEEPREREFSSGSKFQNGDTLLARITPCLENGKTGFVDFLNDLEIGWGSTEFIVLRGRKSINPYFVYCLSRRSSFRDFAIQSMVGSSGRQRVVEAMLSDYPITIPDQKTADLFFTIMDKLFLQVKTNSNQTANLAQTRDALLPKLMSGEIEV
jgi:type I restriction enzyme, S subunit